MGFGSIVQEIEARISKLIYITYRNLRTNISKLLYELEIFRTNLSVFSWMPLQANSNPL